MKFLALRSLDQAVSYF